jgi:CBS domain containing-hemolysin-like protein
VGDLVSIHFILMLAALAVAGGLRVLATAIRGLDPGTLALPEELGARSGEDEDLEPSAPPLVEVLERFLRAVHDLESGALLALAVAALAAARLVEGPVGLTVGLAIAFVGAPLLLVVLPVRLATGREAAVLGHAAPAILFLASVLHPLAVVQDFLAAPSATFAASPPGGGSAPAPPLTAAWAGAAAGPLAGAPSESPSWLKQVLGFTRATVDEVMTPRAEIVAVESGASVADLVQIVRTTRRGRYPIYRSSLDELVGQVELADLLEEIDTSAPVDRFGREVTVVPESKPVFDLAKEMHTAGTGMVMVVDEFGTLAGLANLHDLVGELLGEIMEDERRPVFEFRRVDTNTWVLNPIIRIERLSELIGVTIPEGDYQTLSGFILFQLGRVPLPRERLRVTEGEFEILAADSRRILSVRFKRRPAGTVPAR